MKKRREERALEKAQHEEEMASFYLNQSLFRLGMDMLLIPLHFFRHCLHGNALVLSSKIGRRKKRRFINLSRSMSFGLILIEYQKDLPYHNDSFDLLTLQFHFDQSKVRSEIRLREGRAKPIDILTKHLHGSEDLDIELNEPYMVFKV